MSKEDECTVDLVIFDGSEEVWASYTCWLTPGEAMIQNQSETFTLGKTCLLAVAMGFCAPGSWVLVVHWCLQDLEPPHCMGVWAQAPHTACKQLQQICPSPSPKRENTNIYLKSRVCSRGCSESDVGLVWCCRLSVFVHTYPSVSVSDRLEPAFCGAAESWSAPCLFRERGTHVVVK